MPKIDFPRPSSHVNEAFALPGRFYTEPGVFEAEKDNIFPKEWLPVARFDQIPQRGDYLTYDLFGDEIYGLTVVLSR